MRASSASCARARSGGAAARIVSGGRDDCERQDTWRLRVGPAARCGAPPCRAARRSCSGARASTRVRCRSAAEGVAHPERGQRAKHNCEAAPPVGGGDGPARARARPARVIPRHRVVAQVVEIIVLRRTQAGTGRSAQNRSTERGASKRVRCGAPRTPCPAAAGSLFQRTQSTRPARRGRTTGAAEARRRRARISTPARAAANWCTVRVHGRDGFDAHSPRGPHLQQRLRRRRGLRRQRGAKTQEQSQEKERTHTRHRSAWRAAAPSRAGPRRAPARAHAARPQRNARAFTPDGP